MTSWPIAFAQVEAASKRIAVHLSPTPLRNYPELDAAIGHGVRVWIKHENHQPTQAFKARNALSALSALDDAQRKRGIVGATRGNHGGGLAWAGQLLGIPIVICVPVGNNEEKNAAMRAYGAEVIESGRDYDESVLVAKGLMEERGLHMVHSTNDPTIIAGAATMTLEILEQTASEIDAIVVAVGGGSQAVGALTVVRARAPAIEVFGVQAANASAIHDGYHAGKEVSKDSADTFADGLATRSCYAMTFGPLCKGLTDFVTATEAEIADAIRLLVRTTHNLAEGAGAASTAGLCKLAPRLAGKRVVAVLSGGNIDSDTLRRVMNREL
jgi:threonine dehydratase